MTQCFDQYCSKEGIMKITEHNLRQTKITYWLCEDHYQEKLAEINHPKPLVVEEPQYDYVETKPPLRRWMRFIPHGCSPTWNSELNLWDPCPRCGLVRFLEG